VRAVCVALEKKEREAPGREADGDAVQEGGQKVNGDWNKKC
jgi:hypothetical protein